MKFTTDRVRADKPPTKRERWHCFYRLYRLARKADLTAGAIATEHQAVDALRLIGYHNWCIIANREKSVVGCIGNGRSNLPKFLRFKFLETDKRWRLYGHMSNHYDELIVKDRMIARMYAEEYGVELTLLEAAEERHKLFRKIRWRMVERGCPMPEGDGSDVYIQRLLMEASRCQE